MAKKIIGYIKLQVPAGKANPSPPMHRRAGSRSPVSEAWRSARSPRCGAS